MLKVHKSWFFNKTEQSFVGYCLKNYGIRFTNFQGEYEIYDQNKHLLFLIKYAT